MIKKYSQSYNCQIKVAITAILEQIYPLFLSFLDQEDKDSKLFQNSSNYSTVNTVSHPRNLYLQTVSTSTILEPN
jgi:hypothetical protein